MDNDQRQSNYWAPKDSDGTEAPAGTGLHPSLNQLVTPSQPLATISKADEAITDTTSVTDLPENEELSQEDDIKMTVDWVAPEYYVGDKNTTWYVIFGIITLVLMALAIFLLQSWTFAVLIAVMAFSLIIYSRRPANNIKYTLSVNQGIYINDKLYNLQDYKSFSLATEDSRNSIILIPVKRFSPSLSVYFPTESGEQIVDILAARLPMEEYKPDLLDKIINKLKI